MATLKSVQKGTATIAAGSASGTAAISSVTTANTFISFTYRTANAGDTATGSAVGVSALTSTQITFTRTASTSTAAVNIEWQAIEYSSGVSVQRGNTTITGTTTNVTISAITVAKSWVVMNWRPPAGYDVVSGETCLSAAITTTTNLAIAVNVYDANSIIAHWQVIQYDNCTTALYTHSKTGAGNSTQTVTSVTTTKALIFDTYSWDEDPAHEADIVKMYLTNATTVTFNSYGWQAGTHTHKLYTVDITDSVAVQRGDTAITTGNTVETPSITTVTTANSIVNITSTLWNTLATVNYTTDARTDYNAFTASISAATTVTLTRSTSGYVGICPWEVIDMTGILAAAGKTWVVWIPSV